MTSSGGTNEKSENRVYREQGMMKQLLSEALIIVAGTLFFFALAATVGIPGNERDDSAAVAAEEVALPAPTAWRLPPDIPGPVGGGR